MTGDQQVTYGTGVATSSPMLDVCQNDIAPTDQPITLFISDRGLLEPAGRSQIVPYVFGLAEAGVRTCVISFEKTADLGDASATASLRARLVEKGIEWAPLTYHQRAHEASTISAVAAGAATAIRIARARHVRMVHARGFVPGLIGWSVKALLGASLVFDMRGFWPEESVELGRYRPHGFSYRTSKRLEQFLIGASDHIVVLTESAKAILREREAEARMDARRVREKPITVIPCYADLNRFRPIDSRAESNSVRELEEKVVIGNAGSINKRYMLPEMFRFAFHIKSHHPKMQFVYLARDDESAVRTAARNAGLDDGDLLVKSVDADDVPRWLSMFRLGVFFLPPSYAAKASSYTELAEFLACGVPVVTNTGVGDVDKILGSTRCGVLVSGFRDGALAAAARQALQFLEDEPARQEVRASCRAAAETYFNLEVAKNRYLAIYESLAIPHAAREETPVAVELSRHDVWHHR